MQCILGKDGAMTILTVRNLRPDVHQRLREQAAAHGRSMEAEARALLEAGVGLGNEDPISSFRSFAAEAALSSSELQLIFPERPAEAASYASFDEGSDDPTGH